MRVSKSTRTLIILSFAALLLIALRLVESTWAPPLERFIGEDFLARLNTPWFVIGGEQVGPSRGLAITPVLILQIVLFLVLLTVASRVARRVLQSRILTHTSIDAGQQYALANIFGYLVFFFGLVIGLQTMGLDLSSLTFLGGAVGIGIGFGLQAIVNNFVSGLILLVERPIKVGDRIEVGQTSGDVIRIGPRSTWVRGVDNVVTIVPNSEFVTGRVSNWTAEENVARYRVSVSVAYEEDPERVRSILLAVAHAHPAVLREPAPDVVVVSLGESAVRFDLRFSTASMAHSPQRIASDIYIGVMQAFRESGVVIPYPKREVHVHRPREESHAANDAVAGAPRTEPPIG